jgi:hypothetical protein
VVFRQHLGRQCRSEILILFFDQGHGIVALGVMNLVVRRLAARPILDPGAAFGAVSLGNRNICRLVTPNRFAPFWTLSRPSSTCANTSIRWKSRSLIITHPMSVLSVCLPLQGE